MSAPHHSIFTGRMLFLTPSQQCQSTEGKGQKTKMMCFEIKQKLECGPMPNVMAALPNTGGALYSTPQSLADAHYWSEVQ